MKRLVFGFMVMMVLLTASPAPSSFAPPAHVLVLVDDIVRPATRRRNHYTRRRSGE